MTVFTGAVVAATSAMVLWAAQQINRQEDSRIISETERNHARALIDGLVGNSDSVISVQDPEGRFALVNDAFEREYEIPHDDALGRTAEEVLDPERASRLEALRKRVLNRSGVVTDELLVQNRDHEAIYLAQAFPITDPAGNLIGSGAIATDITERKQHELALQRLNAELKSESRRALAANAELESFAHTVSHDLRSPLRAIDGFVRIVQEECDDVLDDDSRRYLNLALRGAEEMGDLIDDLLEFSRAGRSELHTAKLDMNQLAFDVNDQLDHERDGREVRVTIGELPPAKGDRTLISAVLMNLLSNAHKYSRRRDVAEIEVGAYTAGDDLPPTYYVRDNGVGFDMRYAEKLFAAFERLHRAEDYEGSGVGLATVKRILERHGGEIWAESEPDKGTTMYFRISGKGA